MSKLTTDARKAIPSTKFAGPDRSYPIEDKAHARNAKARVAQFGSPALKARVDAAADKVLKASQGVTKVAPMPPHGSFRGDNSGGLSKEEFAGIPHPVLSSQVKKK